MKSTNSEVKESESNQDAVASSQKPETNTQNPNTSITNSEAASSLTNASEIYLRKSLVMSIQKPLTINTSHHLPITTQPRTYSNLPSPKSLTELIQPPSLFLQALSKVNESSLNSAFEELRAKMNIEFADVPPPDSLTSAPPSYSFVLRQMAARRRPRLMGRFIPSPSFVQHTPPPNYATAFDIYVDPVPSPPTRVYNFGFTSMPVACPECGYTGMTVTRSKITICTHTCAFLLCVFCCWICAPLPYLLKSCKDVYHHCRNCSTYLGMYCPTNPNSTYIT